MKNTEVFIAGTVVENFTYSHEVYGEKFYRGIVQVKRISGAMDNIPVTVSESLIDSNCNYTGRFVSISGEYRSKNIHVADKSSLDLYVFASNVEESDVHVDLNSISLQGFICKEPIYRKTPLGRKICDLLVAVNGSYGRSYYIPCLAWGRNAIIANEFKVGDKVRVSGRIQSREYQKALEDETVERRIAYEVSAAKVELLKERRDKE